MHYNCLIVDDEADLAKMTCEYFELFDVSCACVADAASCKEFLLTHEVDILLLDINLSEESGFALCKSLRETSDIPILFISARQSDEDILVALNIGGDDYIKKPYTLSILLAKVKAVLKRLPGKGREATGKDGQAAENGRRMAEKDGQAAENGRRMAEKDGQAPGSSRQTAGNNGEAAEINGRAEEDAADDKVCRLYLDESIFCAFLDGRRVELKAKEFKLLQCLFENRNTIVTKEKLFEKVWGDAFFGDSTLNVHIRRLREKLEKDPGSPKFIKTVWGTGYLLEI